jgi:hypothetical protein
VPFDFVSGTSHDGVLVAFRAGGFVEERTEPRGLVEDALEDSASEVEAIQLGRRQSAERLVERGR